MAVTHWYTGRASETTATVVVRANSTGNVPVVANGVTQQAACDTAVNDGWAVVEFSDLSPGVRYPYTVAGATGGVLRPFATSGPHWIAFTSCWDISRFDVLAQTMLQAPRGRKHPLYVEMVNNLSATVCVGDFWYSNINSTINGESLSPIDGASGTLANAKSLNLRRAYVRAAWLTPGRTQFMRSVPAYGGKDDHEYDPDNASYSEQWLDNAYAATAPHTLTDLDDVWSAASTAWRECWLGNPPKEITSGIHGGPDCYRIRIGPCEIWVTDLIHERDYTGTIDGPTKRIMSSLQEEWLLSTMASSTAQFKVFVSGKQFISSCGRNSDGFTDLGGTGRGYRAQLVRILQDLRFPTGGALSVTGDEHIRSEMLIDSASLGFPVATISQISAGPGTQDVITNPDDGLAYRAGVLDKERDISGVARRGEWNYVLFRVMPDRLERYVLGSRYGLRYRGYISTSDNAVRY